MAESTEKGRSKDVKNTSSRNADKDRWSSNAIDMIKRRIASFSFFLSFSFFFRLKNVYSRVIDSRTTSGMPRARTWSIESGSRSGAAEWRHTQLDSPILRVVAQLACPTADRGIYIYAVDQPARILFPR